MKNQTTWIQTNEKENQRSMTKPNTKSMNFGKSIKFKAQMISQVHPPLAQKCTQNIKGHQFRPEYSHPIINGQFRRTNSVDQDEQFFKNKAVRFQDGQSFGQNSNVSLQSSRAKKKSASILKKSPSIDKLSFQSGTSDMGTIDGLSAMSSLKDKGKACSNEAYVKLLKMLKYENVKFFDNLFPPGGASLCYSKPRISQFECIKWIRIEQIFKNKKLILHSSKPQAKCIISKGQFNYLEHMAIAMNAISNSNRCLQRIFQEQTVLGLCVYYLRINHDGIWKYITIDDHIPAIKTSTGYKPAFLDVSPNDKGEIEIWPFLIQKCLAKIYNCYECLFNDTVQNLIYQLTGFQCEVLSLEEETSEYSFRNSILHSETISIVSEPYNSNYFTEKCYALRQDNSLNSNTYFNLDITMKLLDLPKNSSIFIDVADLKKNFRVAKIYRIDETYYSLGCIIKQAKNTISMRKFVVKQQQCNCMLTLVQRDKKYYRNNGYDYAWARMMIVTKDGMHGYRWIDGRYENNRILTLICNLEPGQYYIIINGDWKSRAFEMNLNYQGNQEIQFTRQVFDNHPKILSETCMDLAQRFGLLKQYNRNICCYRLIDRQNGFIIQNVNNQVSRSVFFAKQYNLYGKNYELIDKKLYSQDAQNEIETMIPPNSHFTFIVKLIDGFDPELIQKFTFQ